MTRTRSNYIPGPTGSRTRFGGPVYSGGLVLSESCSDEVLSGDNHTFNVVRRTVRGGIINSKQDNGFFGATFRDYPADALNNGQMLPDYSFPEEKPDAMYATAAINRTSPNKPHVDIGINALEMGDNVRLVMEWGRDLMPRFGRSKIRFHSGRPLRDLGKGYLTYGFGIAPVIGDLVKLCQFREQVARRIKVLEKLRDDPKGFRKTVTLDKLSKSNELDIYWQTADIWMVSKCPVLSAREVKGHCRWLPDCDFRQFSKESLEGMAKRAVHGVTLDFSTLWEIVPFSWLIDYGTNVGQYLQNQRNIVPVTLDGVSLIKHSVTRFEIPHLEVSDRGEQVMSAGHLIHETKSRYPVHGDISAQIPFLSESQMGIIASLAVTRR